MSGSEPTDRPSVERELDALEQAVALLIAELAEVRLRAEDAEARFGALSGTLQAAGVKKGDTSGLERRLRELTEENGRLRAIIGEARQRAESIRGRLRVIEDETG